MDTTQDKSIWPERHLKTGDLLPTFCLPDQDNTVICSDALLGRRFVLYVYPKDMTPGCTTEACDFNDRLQSISPEAEIFGLSPDSPESHRRFRDKYKLEFTLLSDPSLETIKALGAYGTKTNYGREYQGLIRSTFIVDRSGRIESALYNVKAKGHAERIKSLITGV